jgi:hypothetical protein
MKCINLVLEIFRILKFDFTFLILRILDWTFLECHLMSFILKCLQGRYTFEQFCE